MIILLVISSLGLLRGNIAMLPVFARIIMMRSLRYGLVAGAMLRLHENRGCERTGAGQG